MKETVLSILPTLLTGSLAFVGTNMDDLILLILFLKQDATSSKKWQVITGQFLGFSLIILLSLFGSLSRYLLRPEFIGFIGLLPIIIGIRKFAQRQNRQKVTTNTSVFLVTILTVSDGFDNISTYSPLFAQETFLHNLFLIGFFFFLLAIWYYIAVFIAQSFAFTSITKVIDRLLPLIFITLGLLIMMNTGTLSWLFAWLAK